MHSKRLQCRRYLSMGAAMPNRILREGILTSRPIASLTDDGEIFYRRLMSIVDDYGRFECDLDILRARLFPLVLDRWPVARIKAALEECRDLIQIYGEGKMYLQIKNFRQKTRSPSKCPDPPCGTDAVQMHSACIADAGNCPPSRSRISESKTEAESAAEFVSVAKTPPIENLPKKQKLWSTQYPIQDLTEVSRTLMQFPGTENLPGEPDDVILTKCLALAGGDIDRLGSAIRGMYLARKKPATSWAWFPVVVGQYLERRRA